jgi:predicted regulator of Ras-like GTPase activity (Roadblock/LC7/MglB family)
MNEHAIEDVLSHIEKDCPGFVAVSVVDLDSGMTLGVRSADPSFDLATASAFNSEMVKQKHKIMDALGLNADLEDMLLTLTDQIHLIKLIGRSSFIYLAARREGSNLALVRNAVNKNAAPLLD